MNILLKETFAGIFVFIACWNHHYDFLECCDKSSKFNSFAFTLSAVLYQAGDTRIPLPRKSLWTPTKNCRLQSWTLYKSVDCRWISITILCISFTNSTTFGWLEQVQLCNRRIDQSADNITGLKCTKECLILKYKYIQNPWLYFLTCHWWYKLFVH